MISLSYADKKVKIGVLDAQGGMTLIRVLAVHPDTELVAT